MSPTPLPRSPRRVRPWLAAALMMTVWLSSTPARCDPGPGIAQLAASTLAGPAWQVPASHTGDGPALLEAAAAQGLPGVVAKRLTSPYRPGPADNGDWILVPA